jgi:hypothetical protein
MWRIAVRAWAVVTLSMGAASCNAIFAVVDIADALNRANAISVHELPRLLKVGDDVRIDVEKGRLRPLKIVAINEADFVGRGSNGRDYRIRFDRVRGVLVSRNGSEFKDPRDLD